MTSAAWWCATCQKTHPTGTSAAECGCGDGVPAARGEWSVNLEEFRGNQRLVPCHACAEPLFWIRAPSGAKVPLVARTARTVDCYSCTRHGSRRWTCRHCTGAGVHVLALSHFVDCPKADEFRRGRRPAR